MSFFYQNTDLLDEVKTYLQNFPDLERAINKLLIGRGGPRDFLVIVNALKILCSLKSYFNSNMHKYEHNFAKLIAEIPDLTFLYEELNIFKDAPPLLCREGNFIKSQVNEQLDYQRSLRDNSNGLIAKLEEKYRSKTQIVKLKIRATNILGYYIEIPSNLAVNIDKEYFSHKQTLANNTRFVTEELNSLQADIYTAEQKSLDIELAIFSEKLQLLDDNLVLLKKL